MIRDVELKVAEVRGANSVLAGEYRAAIPELRHGVDADQTSDLEPTRLLQRREVN